MTDRERFFDADHFGRSMAVPMSRTARDLVSDLHALLQTAHAPDRMSSLHILLAAFLPGYTPARIRRRLLEWSWWTTAP